MVMGLICAFLVKERYNCIYVCKIYRYMIAYTFFPSSFESMYRLRNMESVIGRTIVDWSFIYTHTQLMLEMPATVSNISEVCVLQRARQLLFKKAILFFYVK